jgi:uncharacterized membrane protein
MWHDDGWGMTGWWPAGLLLMVAALTVLAAVVLLMSRRTEDVADWRFVLDGRLARGEITEDEYRHLRQVLRSG